MSPQQRRDSLRECFSEVDDSMQEIIFPLIDDIVFIEEHLRSLRELPFIRFDRQRPQIQKATPAARQYKEFLQQYNNCIKILVSVLRRDTPEEESPLRAWLNARDES